MSESPSGTKPTRIVSEDRRLIRSAALMLAYAFAKDPLYEYLLPRTGSIVEPLSSLMAALITLNVPGKHCYCIGRDPVAVALLQPPSVTKIKASRLLSVLLRYGWRFRSKELRRMLRVLTEFESHRPVERHWYLMLLGVKPTQQKRGFGRSLLSLVSELAQKSNTGIYLETTNPTNVLYYQDTGYEVVAEFRSDRGQGPVVWSMLSRSI